MLTPLASTTLSSRFKVLRQTEREPGAGVGVLGSDGASVGRGDGLHNRQPQTVARPCRGVTTAVEAAEQVGQVSLRNATAIIRHGDRYPSRFQLQRNLHRPARPG